MRALLSPAARSVAPDGRRYARRRSPGVHWRRWLYGALLASLVGSTALSAQAQAPAPRAVRTLKAEADRLFEQRRFDEARDVYLKIYPQLPRDPDVNRNLGWCFYRGERPNLLEAIEYWRKAWEVDGDETLKLEAARAYVQMGRWAEGTPLLLELARQHPEHPQHWRDLATIAEAAREYPQAVAWYRAYVERRPRDGSARLSLARLLGWTQQYDEALAEYRGLLEDDPRNLAARLGVAQVLAWQGNFADSIERYEAILAEQPANVDAQAGKAFALLWMGHHGRARPLFEAVARDRPADRDVQAALQEIARRERAGTPAASAPGSSAPPEAPATPGDPLTALRLQVDQALTRRDGIGALALARKGLELAPDDVDLQRRMAQAHLVAGQFDEALAALEQVRSAHPDNRDVQRDVAAALAGAGRYSAAADAWAVYLQTYPEDGEARIDMARLLSWSRRFDEAERAYRDVLQEDPGSLASQVGLAQVDAWRGRYAAALEQFDAILATHPGQREALMGRAQTLFWTGQRDAASRALEQLRQAFPNDAEVASLAESLEEAARRQVGDTSDLDASIERYTNDLARNPGDVKALRALGDLNARRSHLGEAIGFYRQASELQPGDRELQHTLARVLSWNRQYDAALETYRAILDADPGNHDAQVEYARVHAWKGDFDHAIELYAALEAQYAQDRDVLLGKAQTLQWSGRAGEAQRLLESLRVAYPEDRDVRLALAATQLALGRGDLALRELQQLAGGADDRDVQLMRSLVLRQQRPVLVFSFAPSKDSDDLEIAPMIGTLYFSALPRVRSYVRGSFVPATTPTTGGTRGRETIFGSTVQVAPRFIARGEVGADFSRGSAAAVVGGGGVTLLASPALRIDLDAGRQFLNYLPLAVERDISRVQLRGSVDVRPTGGLLVHVDYMYGRYSDDNESQTAGAIVSQTLTRGEHVNLEAGYLFSYSSFAEQTGNGYYAPSRLQRHAGLANLYGRLSTHVGYGVSGTLGAEQAFDDPYRLDGTIRASTDVTVTEQLKVSVGYGYFRIASPAGSGAYRTHSAFGTLEIRF